MRPRIGRRPLYTSWGALTTLLILVLTTIEPIVAQWEGVADALFGPVSLVRGMKNVMGGVWAADKVHHKCLQRTICDEFSDEVINMTEVEDPVKRTRVLIPQVVRRRGRLRFLGDAVVKSVAYVGNKLGLNPDRVLRRRQGEAGSNSVLMKAVGMAMDTWSSIPVQQMTHVMDFAADSTNVVERKGNVYPLIKSSAMGYAYGSEREEEFDGVCAQMAPDCDDNWKHIETINMYEGGALSRVVADRSAITRDTRGSADDPIVWNSLSMDDATNPRVLLCKTSRFLEKLNEKMGGDGVVKERYGTEDFDRTCDPAMLNPPPAKDEDSEGSVAEGGGGGGGDDANLSLSEIEIIDARDKAASNSTETTTLASMLLEESESTKNETNMMDELPLIVVEGLSEPPAGLSEEQNVEGVFKDMKLIEQGQHFVRTAIRLPMKPGGRSLVMVELDALEQEETLLDHTSDTMEEKVSIRRAKYRELWKFLRQTNTIASLINITRRGEGDQAQNRDGSNDDDLNTIHTQPT